MSEATGRIPGQPRQSDPYDGARAVLSVPKAHVKIVKSLLESHKIFDRYHGISPEPNDAKHAASNGQRMRVPTTIPCVQLADGWSTTAERAQLLVGLQLHDISPDITCSSWIPPETNSYRPVAASHNPLRKAVREALEALPSGTLASLNLTIDALVVRFPDSYSIYKPLLLLPSNSLGSDLSFIVLHHAGIFERVWDHIADALHCTHIALNSPIPPSNTPSSAHAGDEDNILRSPVNLTPIYGTFGPSPTLQTLSAPSQKDFEDALWVHTTQNSVHQTWAPLYTMFSRGNVKEKARLLSLPSITSLAPSSSASQTQEGATAVDMYAGIGYFSFSYRRAGLTRVLCWELNPWSVEGLRRGAALNNWSGRVFTPADIPSPSSTSGEWEAWRTNIIKGKEDFWIFAMSNETADRIVQCLRDYIPPVRHVNLGLLPVSRLSWPSAVRAVDRRLGGWVHAHENVGVVEMDERKVEVETEFQRLTDECADERRSVAGDAEGLKRKAQVEHVEKVKTYAPGVVHAVIDVHIPGTQAAE
ncbi:hypothetical protein BU25DRAFT_445916 [Macroventuria anomochaeta]|uniref:Uncharacterized protein n=1 Tax=Macroventuria anomochaeta TaxID=301207 RepID=A0ACB6S9J0_9PLEO|nr:uncharacterized protein BU25DRAFT_445916 [Macroventuria anomochaeta]KAF2630935.1 hypothetical protein BU25DRAFT_445916 [Macroventuria anomochaeta]